MRWKRKRERERERERGGGGNTESCALHCHHQHDFFVKMGSDKSQFDVSFTPTGKFTRQCP